MSCKYPELLIMYSTKSGEPFLYKLVCYVLFKERYILEHYELYFSNEVPSHS